MSSCSDATTDSLLLSDEEMRKLLKPCPTSQMVIDALTSSYAPQPSKSISVRKELDSYDDCNFLVEISGVYYLAKVHNGVESRQYIEAEAERRTDPSSSSTATSIIHLQNAIFQHLNKPDFDVNSSLSMPVMNHESNNNHALSAPLASVHSLPVISPAHSPCLLVVRLLTWVPGNTMSSCRGLSITTFVEAGAYLGKICKALDSLDSSALRAAQRYHAWDGKNTADLSLFVTCIQSEERRALVQSVIDTFNEQLIDSGESLLFRQGVLQGDYNDANIILNEAGNISGVIDFGDCIFSWKVLDITVAMAYAMISSFGKAGKSISAAAAILCGFHSVYPLTFNERKHLRLLIACRLSCSVTLGAYSSQQNPENKYLLLHSAPAWNALEFLWCHRQDKKTNGDIPTAIDRMFDTACDKRDVSIKSTTTYKADSFLDISLSDCTIVENAKKITVPREKADKF